jgi:thymidylate kinase
MQIEMPLPSQPPVRPFSEFICALTQALEEEGLRPCVLRNYEGFPAANLGGDVDFLILRSDLPRAIRVLRSIKDVRTVGYCLHPHVASVYVEGVSADAGCRLLRVDFYRSLSWKQLPYIPVDAVLRVAEPRQAEDLRFFIPSPVHEAIISLLASLIVGGWLNEKYFPKLQQKFAEKPSEVIAALQPQFGYKVAARLVESVNRGDRKKILDCVRPLRSSLAVRSLLRRPIRSILALVRHFSGVAKVSLSPKNIEIVSILGADGSRVTRTVECLLPILQWSASKVEKRNFKGVLPLPRTVERSGSSAPRAQAGLLTSVAMIVARLFEDWRNQIPGKVNLTLRICNGYYHDLIINPQRYGYGGPMWFARLAGKFFPSPELWILLDTPLDVTEAKDQEDMSEKTVSQFEAYRSFVKTRSNYVIIDAGKPIATVAEDAYAAIVDTLAKRTDRQLKHLDQRITTN